MKYTFILLDTFHYIIGLVYLAVQIKWTTNTPEDPPTIFQT